MPEPAHDAVGVHAVDPDAVLAELGGEQPHLVGLVGLGRAVGDVVRAGEDRVLRGDVDDVAAHALVDHRLGRGPGDQEGALGHHVVLQVPVLLGRLQQRLADREAGVVHHEVDPAERQRRRVHGGLHGVRVGDVGDHRDRAVGRADACRRPRRRSSASRSATTTQAPSAASRSAMALPMPEPAPVTSATRAGQRLGLRHPLELGLLEGPVLDAELLALVDRCVRRDGLGAAHHVDGVDVELAGHAGGLLVLAEREHPDAGHQHDRRVGAAHGRAVRRPCCGRSRRRTPRGRRRAARAGGATVSSTLASRGQVDDQRAGPWCAGSGPGTRCPARPAASASRGTGTPAPRRCRCSGRAAGRRWTRGRGSPAPARPPWRAAPRRAAPRSPARPRRTARPCRARRGTSPRCG